jgi:asparagine synthase (glutamine-hydrolysing)
LGVFFLSKRDSSGLADNWWQVQRRGGFGRCVPIDAGDWTLRLCGKLNGSGPHHVRRGADFAACTGVFFYRGRRLEAGLELLLDEFDGGSFPWVECRGHYAVVLFKGGRLWLASDELGAYKIFRNIDGTRFSSSFGALRATLSTAVPDEQGIYEYVFNGATFGEKTLLRHIKQQRAGCLYSFGPSGPATMSAPPVRHESNGYGSIDEAVDDYAERLRALFRVYGSGSMGFRTALSGGYDSRLILALLLDTGIRPDLFVYGNDDDPDVLVAKAIAEGEGLPLRHIHKDALAPKGAVSPEMAWIRFDSWKVDGLFDTGVDERDRCERASGGVDILNGSGGECFRNFFYLRDRSYSPEEIVWSFYYRFDPSHVTDRFRRDAHVAELAEDMRRSLPGNPRERRLGRDQVEALYPLFRVRYWTGRDVGLNQRFGPLLFPFVEPSVFAGTERIPIHEKDHGRFEARILTRIAPKLAAYESSYGFSLASDPPLKYRLKMGFTLWRPPFLRQFSYRIQSRIRGPAQVPGWFTEALEAANLDPRLPRMREYFHVERISDLDVLNRIATVELVLQGGPWPLPDPHNATSA